jgi:hypothetical protein
VTLPLSASGNDGTVTWTLKTGQLPAGLTLSSDGVLAGTPLVAARPRFTIRITDATSRVTDVNYQPTVAAPLRATTSSLVEGTVGAAYPNVALRSEGGRGPFTWSVTDGGLPAGMALSSAGRISGTATTDGDSSFTATVTDADGRTSSKALTLTVRPALQLSGGTLAGGSQGVAYSAQLAASGGNGIYTFRRASGVLPAGLTVAPSGAITGAPIKAGTYSFTANVRDSYGRTANAACQIVVAPAQAPNVHRLYRVHVL